MPSSLSKRGALRFPGSNMIIRYRTEYEDGEAELVNISTNGCAVSGMTTELSVNEKVLLLLDLDQEEIQVQAVVVRFVEEKTAGLQFVRVSEDSRSHILHFYARKARLKTNDSATTP